ncbi:WD40 repeat-like protein [Cylindrobasidium torrendii FP15055 ss-10]|uniref:Pre-rRNA-processing protein IPI3 n=1 Tax=Cylindrobasidium torrendii FP15055 ss-10 TaxID=1314674 RepID=A0A0D7BGJ6_9AGAR|nr:WD40 repeat-like protein [Cylindrobasidium torrendii FP15055 ss-10]
MQHHETVFCSTASETAGPGAVYIHDIQSGNALASFKQTNAATHCTAFVDSVDSQGGFILAAQPTKSLLHVYNFQKDQISLKIVLPEKLSCVALDPKGEYAAGGTANGRLYLWEVSSGVLFHAWDAHYREVTVLRFTQDSAALISASKDSGVSVWSISRLLDDDQQNELVVPYCTFSDHTLPVTDLICGAGSFPSCRVLTSSLDHTVKLWDMSSKSLLTTFQLPKPITCLAWDPTERLFFAASACGSIHQMNLFRERQSKVAGHHFEAVGGAGATDNIQFDADGAAPTNKRLISVGQEVTCMAFSLTAALLLVGTAAGLINIYDVASHQLIRSITSHKGFAITHLATMLRPPDLVGHVTLTLSLGSTSEARDVIPVKPVQPFQRMRDPGTRERHEVSMLLPSRGSHFEHEEDFVDDLTFMRDHAHFVAPAEATNDSGALRIRVADLETEVQTLREQLGKAKGVNDVMWTNVVQKVIGGGKDERPRKRGRNDA